MSHQMKAGAGKARIVFPHDMFPLEGFMDVHDDPHIRILMIESGERIVIASMEIVNLFGDGTELVRRLIAEKCGTKYENVWLHTTHAITTPHPPRVPDKNRKDIKLPPHMQDPDAARKRELYFEAVTKAVSCACEQAIVLQDARLGYGKGTCDVNVNRDVETPFGWWVGFNPDGYSCKDLHVLKLENENGQIIALLVNYGLKPCAIDNSGMQEGVRRVSSDLPGYACTIVEERLNTVCLYIMSAAGDQVPKEMALFERVSEDGFVEKIDLGVEKGLEIVRQYGAVLGADILSTANAVSCNVSSADIRRGYGEINCLTKGRIRMQPRKQVEYTCEKDAAVSADVIALGDIAFVAVKPEVNAITESQLQAKSPFKTTLVFSMTNGDMKYMPDKAAYERITWESQSAMLTQGAAENWVEKAAQVLKQVH